MKNEMPGCARCPIEPQDRLCQKEDGKSPKYCPTLKNEEAINKSQLELKKPGILVTHQNAEPPLQWLTLIVTQTIVYIGCMHPGFFSQFVALLNHPEVLIPVRNPIPLRNFFTRSPGVKRVGRNGISFVNPVVNPYDPGITFPDSSVRASRCLFFRAFSAVSLVLWTEITLFARFAGSDSS